jgi:4-diphosphocytidyl-2-C-methyl-D-erythritol kinase
VLVVRANAKINLGLEILGRRSDGYHEVVTILQEIDLADTLTFLGAPSLQFTCDVPELSSEANLVPRAARRLQELTGVSRGAAIHLHKSIPSAAGLGGGSADAAATLIGLNQLWGLNLRVPELADVARELGTDVAFFLRGGTQLATGRGGDLDPVPTGDLWAVLVAVAAGIPDKTRCLYAALRPADWSDGQSVRTAAESLRRDRSIPPVLPSGFARATRELFPATREAFEALRDSGAEPILCGAGPTVMTLHRRQIEAVRVADTARQRGYAPLVVRSMPASSRLSCR